MRPDPSDISIELDADELEQIPDDRGLDHRASRSQAAAPGPRQGRASDRSELREAPGAGGPLLREPTEPTFDAEAHAVAPPPARQNGVMRDKRESPQKKTANRVDPTTRGHRSRSEQPTRAGHLADMRRTPTPGRRTGPPRPAQARPPRPAQAHPTRPSSEAKSADPTPPRKRGPRRRRRRDEPRIDPNLGRVLGSYRILSLIGAGGMGQVYMAEHTMLGRKVALKLLRPEYAVKRDAVHRFFQEARAVNAIDHENIVDITDYVELDSGETFFIMELLEGKDLSDYLRKADQPIPLHQAMDIALQVCDALHAAHGKHIIHRDLKPDNIFIVNSGTRRWFVKLLDFGVAKLQDAAAEDASYQTAVGSVIGTPAYMSPEQASGLPIDHRSDIYSFGAILYEMFTGHPVFRAKSFGEFVVKHMNDQPIPPRDLANAPKLPMALEGVILRCLEKDPDKRYATVADLREDLARATATVETVVKMTVTTPSKGTRRDSSWLLIPIGAGVVALAIAAFLWASGIVGGNEGPKPIPRPGTQSPPASHPTGVAAVPLKQTPQGETVLLKIRSTPQGASVFEKGKKGSLGETPFELRLPSPEDPKTPIVLVFKLEGYPTQEREIGIHAQTLTVAFTDSQVASDVAKVGPKGRKTSSARSKHRRRPPKHRSVKHETPTVIDPDAKKPATKKPKKINETDQVDPFAS